MLSRLGATVTGQADNCQPIAVNDTKVAPELLSWILPTETPMIILHSAVKDFIWTDKALIIIARFNSTGTKRSVVRLDYNQAEGKISDVGFETAGTGITDLDCELKFTVGGQPMSIDITKTFAETGKKYYLALVSLENAQRKNAQILQTTLSLMQGMKIAEHATLDKIDTVVVNLLEKYSPASYKEVLSKALLE